MPKGKHKKAKMTDDEVIVSINEQIFTSLGKYDSELSTQRTNAMEAYYGDALGNEVSGRSQIVTRDVMEVIEWVMPEMMDVFTSDDQIAMFMPNSEQDEDEAKQATDYVNHVFFNNNDGFNLLFSAFKDAFLQKLGTFKIWWDDTPVITKEEYSGLDDYAFQKLVSDEDVEVVEHSATPLTDEVTTQALGLPPGMPFMLHDLCIRRTDNKGRIRVEVVPPEELLIDRYARSVEDAKFIAHRIPMKLSEVRELFPDIDADIIDGLSGSETDDEQFSKEYQARHTHNTGFDFDGDNSETRTVWITESYIYMDYDGDDRAELRKICTSSNNILSNDEVECKPFACITPIPIPHKLIGLSLADITIDLQVTKSAIMRNLLDNIYNLNHGRFEAVDGQVNMDDLLTSRPGGVVRVQQLGALKRLDTPAIPTGGYEMLGVVDSMRDARTGVSKFRAGLDTEFLNNAKAGPVDNQMEAANARIRLYARIFKETGVKDVFKQIYKLTVMHQQHEDTINLRGSWVKIDPSAWGGKCNLKIRTGLGHGDKAKTIQSMAMIGQQYSMLRQDPELKRMVTPDNVYTAFAEGLRAMEHKNVGDFITDPKKLEPYKPSPDPKQQEVQAKTQVEMKKLELEEKKLQMEGQRMQAQMGMDQQKAQMEMQKLQLDMQKEEQKNMIEMAKLRSQLSAEEQQNMIEHEKSNIEVMKLQADMSKMQATLMMKDAEIQLKEQELQLEREQGRGVKLGQ